MNYVHQWSPAGGCWTVGFYDGGDWEPVSDHDTEHGAADEAARLNGRPELNSTGAGWAKCASACLEAAIQIEAWADYPSTITPDNLREIAADLRTAYDRSFDMAMGRETAP